MSSLAAFATALSCDSTAGNVEPPCLIGMFVNFDQWRLKYQMY